MTRKYTEEEVLINFWGKIEITADDDRCWNWKGRTNRKGYGLTDWNGKGISSHRLAWSLPNYIIPDGLYVCHSCDNPACCNPKHLFIGTSQDNTDDKIAKGRHPVGEKNTNAKLNDAQVIEIQQLYAQGNISQRKLAVKYGVAHATIGTIVRGTSRGYITHIPAGYSITDGWNPRNTSGYKGVSWYKPRKKWKASISVNNKERYLGLHDTPEEAYEAYCKAKKELRRELNREVCPQKALEAGKRFEASLYAINQEVIG